MRELHSYSLAELEERTGFSRRIIAFYVQQGLLPKVGRRGPRTRYPETFLHRLQLISEIRDLQDRGQLPSATLAEIRQLLEQLTPEELRQLIHQGIPAAEIATRLEASAAPSIPHESPEARHPRLPGTLPPAVGPTVSPAPALPAQRRSYGLADAGIRARPVGHGAVGPGSPTLAAPAPAGKPPDRAPDPGRAAPPTSDAGAELGELLRQIELMVTMSRQQSAPGAAEQWTQIPITGRIYLSVRGLAPDSAPLAEEAGRRLRRALRERSEPR